MDDLLTKFLAGQQVFSDRVHAITEDQWNSPTPCAEWTVADLVGHMIEEHRFAGPLVHGHDLNAASTIVDGERTLPVDGGVGANPAEDWDTAATTSVDAFSADGALGRSVALSRGATPAADYIAEMIFDLVLHSWDLGRAIGYDEPVPAELADAVHDWTKAYDLAATGLFEDPVEVAATASSADRLAGLTGRDPA